MSLLENLFYYSTMAFCLFVIARVFLSILGVQ